MKLVKYGWYALLIAIVGDICLSFVFPLFYRDYQWLTMSISALGNPQSPVRGVFNSWMLIEGILFLNGLPAIYQRYNLISRKMTITLLSFIGLFAVGACIFTYFFSVNETKEIVTQASLIHEAGSTIGFMAFLFVPLLLAILSYKNGEKATGTLFIVCFIVAFAFFVLFVLSEEPEFAGTVIGQEGLWERLNLIFMYLPVGVVSIKEKKVMPM